MSEYDRVTDVLKPFSGMDKIPDFILANAADRGKAVHESCESIIKNLGEMPIKEEWQGYVESFKKWHNPQCKLFMPERLFCDKLQITGLADLVVDDDGLYYLYDIKTSAQENKTWKLQLSAYSYLLNECSGIKIYKMFVLMLDKEGNAPKILSYNDDLVSFLYCLDVYRQFFKSKKEEIDIELI